MSDINRAIYLYELMVKKFEKSGFGENQAQTYRETINLMKNCSTIDEAMSKIKNSKYYLMPSIAIMIDKFESHKKAAIEIDIPELVEIYQKKIAEIEENHSAIYETGYETKVRAIWKKDINNLELFSNIYLHYLELKILFSNNDLKIAHESLIKKFKKLESQSDGFSILAKKERFRKIIPVNNREYKDFVENIPKIMNSFKKNFHDKNEVSKELSSEMKEFSENKDKIKKIAIKTLPKMRKSQAIAIAPNNKNGKYEYINIVEEEFDGV